MIFKQLGFPEKQNVSSIVSETKQKQQWKKENIKIGHVLSDGGSIDWPLSILQWICRGDSW